MKIFEIVTTDARKSQKAIDKLYMAYINNSSFDAARELISVIDDTVPTGVPGIDDYLRSLRSNIFRDFVSKFG